MLRGTRSSGFSSFVRNRIRPEKYGMLNISLGIRTTEKFYVFCTGPVLGSMLILRIIIYSVISYVVSSQLTHDCKP